MPRVGSGWVYNHLEVYNSNIGLIPLRSITGSSEFLRNDNTIIINNKEIKSYYDKIDFLMAERENRIEYSYKPHYSHIKDKHWFLDFYKDYTIVKIDRRNRWEQFLSYTYAFFSRPLELPISEIDKFFHILSDFDSCKIHNETLFYEDLNDDFIKSAFDVNPFPPSHNIEYRRSKYKDHILNYQEVKLYFDYKIMIREKQCAL